MHGFDAEVEVVHGKGQELFLGYVSGVLAVL